MVVSEFGFFKVTVNAKEDWDQTVNFQEGSPLANKNFTGWTDFYGALGGDTPQDAPFVKLTVTVVGLPDAGNLRFQASSGLTTALNQKCEMERGCDIWGLDASGDLKLIGSGKYDIRYTNATDFS